MPVERLRAMKVFTLGRPLEHWLANNMERFDVVDTQLSFLGGNDAVSRWARKKKIVYFYHQRGNLDPTHFGKNRFFKEIFIRLIEGRILRRANRLIALTQHERDIFEQWAPGQAVSVLPNGVNFDLWQIPVPVEKALPNLSFLRDDLPILLWFSRYNKFKNPDLFIDLVASLKVRGHEFHAVMAGSDEDNLRSHCERRAKNEGLGSILTVLPELRDESRQAILQRCDIFVLPTHGEGFSMSILEAMAASCVIITSTGANFPSWPPS